MSDVLDRPIAPSPDAFSQSVADETVLLQVKRAAYYGMDPIGTRIWAAIRDGRSPRDVCADLAREYGVPVEQVEDDARAFLEDLASNDIVTLG